MTPSNLPSPAGLEEEAIDNELDLRDLLCALWKGKLIIITCGAIVLILSTFIYFLIALLRTPNEPVNGDKSNFDKSRRLFLVALWGIMGILIGSGITLLRSH